MRVRKNFEEGKPWNGTLIGYHYRKGVYVIEPDEAEIVRRIFQEFLSDKGIIAIANGLTSRLGRAWSKSGVRGVLKDGTKAVKRWQDRSRTESWTPEMKEAARQKEIERNKRNG